MPDAQPAGEQPPTPSGEPALPAPQPAQEREAASVPAAGASGASQVRGTQAAPPGAASCSPGLHARAAATHWMGRMAPAPYVVVPSGHATQEVLEAPPATLL
jgi:hypothetical protein